MSRSFWRVVVTVALLWAYLLVSALQPSGPISRIRKPTVCHSNPVRLDYIDKESYWVYMFYLLMVYKDREGNCNVPFRHIEDGWNLGVWLSKQREAKKNGKLDSVYQSRLEESGVIWDPCEERWETMFQLLVRYKARENHCNIPQMHREDGECLGNWLNTQRMEFRDGSLNPTRKLRLEREGVAWNAQLNKWDQMYQLLIQYKEREEHCNVPVKHKEDGQSLGSWLGTQRKAKKNGSLSIERQQNLEKIGVVWSVREEQWDQMYSLLCQYIKREGHHDIPIDHKENGKNLGHWLSKQRQLHRSKKLQPGRGKRLEEVGVTLL